MQFAWKDGSRIKIDPHAVGQELTRIQNDHGLTPEIVVEAARNPESPLHKGFEWDDSVAAAQYRLDQARYLLRMIVVVENKNRTPIRAFVSVQNTDQKRVYRDIASVFSNEYLREQALEQALRDLDAFQRKYRDLSELAEVLQAADRMLAAGE